MLFLKFLKLFVFTSIKFIFFCTSQFFDLEKKKWHSKISFRIIAKEVFSFQVISNLNVLTAFKPKTGGELSVLVGPKTGGKL